MNHNLQISVSEKPKRNGIVSYKKITLRERFVRMLFGKKQNLMILIPGDTIEELSITKVRKEKENERTYNFT